MDLLERRNETALTLSRAAEFEAQLVNGAGFDPDSQQYLDAVRDREQAQAAVERMDQILAAQDRAAPRDVPPRERLDWATTLIPGAVAGEPARAVDVPLDRAYHVVTSTEPYVKADTVTVRPTAPAATYPTPIIDASTTVNVSGNNYRYVTLPPPISPGVVAENAAKLGVEFTSTEASGSLVKNAYIVDVTSETLEDEPQAQQILSSWLVSGINRKMEADAAAAVTAGSGYITASTGASGTIAEAIRLGISTLQSVGLTANAALLNPTDLGKLDLQLLTVAGSNSQTVLQTSVWGVSLIASSAVSAGTVFVGDFKAGVLHIQRSSASVDITDSGMSVETTPRDRFTHNLYGLRAEARYKTVLQQPKAICKVTVTALMADDQAAPASKK